MKPDSLALVSFVLITIFTPGPNNISTASMGVLVGHRRTLPYILGITTGFFIMMSAIGLVSDFLLEKIPAFEGVLRMVGALYILWLAWHTLRESYTFSEGDQRPLGFLQGLLLQVLNVKLLVFGLTLYGTFLHDRIPSLFQLFLSAALFSLLTFAAVNLWTLFGAAIRKYLNRPRIRLVVNIILALLLVYTAVDMSGIF